MISYKKEFLKFWQLDETDYIECWMPKCFRQSVDLHHIYGRLGRLLNDPFNLIPLCRQCHQASHSKEILDQQSEIVRNKILEKELRI